MGPDGYWNFYWVMSTIYWAISPSACIQRKIFNFNPTLLKEEQGKKNIFVISIVLLWVSMILWWHLDSRVNSNYPLTVFFFIVITPQCLFVKIICNGFGYGTRWTFSVLVNWPPTGMYQHYNYVLGSLECIDWSNVDIVVVIVTKYICQN